MTVFYGGRGHKGPSPEVAEKIAAVQAMRDAGRTLQSIGDELGVSRQRVHQLIHRQEDGAQYRSEAKNAYQRRVRS